MKQSFHFLLLFLLAFVSLSSCNKVGEETPEDGNVEEEGIVSGDAYIIDISEESDADMMILANDGSYIIYDADTEYGSIVYLNASWKNPLEEGITILLDEKNLPKSALIDGRYVFFSNYTENTFDAICVDSDGSKHFYGDITLPLPLSEFYSITANTRVGLSNEAKVKLGYTAKMVGYVSLAVLSAPVIVAAFVPGATTAAVIAGGVALVGVCTTILSEAKDAFNWQYPFIDDVGHAASITDAGFSGFFDSKTGNVVINGKVFLKNIAANFLIDTGKLFIEEGTTYEDELYYIFDNEEYHIKLEHYLIEKEHWATTFNVNVYTKSFWKAEIITPGAEKWCQIEYGTTRDHLNVTLLENGPDSDRSCQIRLWVDGANGRLSDTILIIKQNCSLIEVVPTELTFDLSGGSKGVIVILSKWTEKWSIAEKPEWCKIEPGTSSFFVDVDASDVERSGEIIVVGERYDREPESVTVKVTQKHKKLKYIAFELSGSCTNKFQSWSDDGDYYYENVETSDNSGHAWLTRYSNLKDELHMIASPVVFSTWVVGEGKPEFYNVDIVSFSLTAHDESTISFNGKNRWSPDDDPDDWYDTYSVSITKLDTESPHISVQAQTTVEHKTKYSHSKHTWTHTYSGGARDYFDYSALTKASDHDESPYMPPMDMKAIIEEHRRSVYRQYKNELNSYEVSLSRLPQ